MAIQTLAQRNALVTSYTTAAPNGTLFSATPGTTGAATNELTGGSPAFARKALAWSAASASASTGSATFDIPSGATVAFSGVCVSAVLTTADVRDFASVTSQAFASQGTYAVTDTITIA